MQLLYRNKNTGKQLRDDLKETQCTLNLSSNDDMK